MDIIIFSGQSNMQGQSESLSDSNVVEKAYEYKLLTNEALPLKNPVGEDITYALQAGFPPMSDTDFSAWRREHALGSACYGNTNLVPHFCKAYTEITGREVLAVHAAKGSTVIAQWLSGSEIYDILIKKVRGALQYASGGRVFFVWLQGESDAIEGNSKKYYKERLLELCEALKRDVGIERFGIIRVGRFTGDARDDEIIFAQDEICEECEDFLMLTRSAAELCTDTAYMNPYVHGHYGARGLEKLGEEAGRTLAISVK